MTEQEPAPDPLFAALATADFDGEPYTEGRSRAASSPRWTKFDETSSGR